jgi:hypothetical protein
MRVTQPCVTRTGPRWGYAAVRNPVNCALSWWFSPAWQGYAIRPEREGVFLSEQRHPSLSVAGVGLGADDLAGREDEHPG